MPLAIVKTVDLSRDAWLEARRKGIGGSDAAAILGLSEWRGPFAVWADKLGKLPEKEQTEAMRLGNDLEEYVAQRFTEATGKRVRRNNAILQHPEHPFMLANIDRAVVGEDAGLECKTTNMLNLKKFKNGDYPADYYCQCVHYMAVTGNSKWYLAVLVLGQDFMVFEIERDEDEIAALIKAESDFWKLVESETPPETDGTESTKKALELVYPTREVKDPVALFGCECDIERRAEITKEIKVLETEQKAINNKLIAALKGAEAGVAHGYKLTYTETTRKAYSVEESTYRALRVKEVKQKDGE